MALETVTHISDLNVANPTVGDPKSQGDDHIRNIKSALKTDFPNITGPVTPSHTQLNLLLASSNAATGYQKLPSGIIVQWGSGLFGDASVITFPTAFPTACVNVVITAGNYDPARPDYQKVIPIAAYNLTATGFTGSSARGNLAGAVAGYWIAIGY